ncbi:MAG: hypothetical protein GWP59_06320 [Chlamydiales bacterium]|nr:nicotinamide mononucleotide transporter family protein [Chlamydiales bacterium]NCF71298.1 hypothetical protein [Chlamydiales bacterium]
MEIINWLTENPTWVLVALSLAGNYFVIKKNVVGQWLWAVSNVGWVTHNLSIGQTSQAFLFAVYLGLCVIGIYTWTRDDRKAKAAQTS